MAETQARDEPEEAARGAGMSEYGGVGLEAEWALSEPGIFEGFTRNQEKADTLEATEEPRAGR